MRKVVQGTFCPNKFKYNSLNFRKRNSIYIKVHGQKFIALFLEILCGGNLLVKLN